MSKFIEITPDQFSKSPFTLIGKEWMLITAEKDNKLNTMTASWGGFGVMWNKNVAFVVIRPQRFTKEFVDACEHFSLSFFSSEFKKQLNYLGTTSGRNENKIEKSGLTVVTNREAPYFEEAHTAVICKKLYAQNYTPECFIDTSLNEKWYPSRDYHTLYIAEVTKIIIKH